MPPLVLFDLDNTLLDRAKAFREWAVWFSEEGGMGEGAPEWLVEHDRDGKISREVFFGELRERFEVAISVAELIDAYDREYVARIRPDPDVLAALGALRHDGWRIGVVTNGGATQRSKLARASLDDLIDGCCVSREFGVAKPDPRIFEETARRCGAPLSGWMVGDHPVDDVAGGQAVKLRTIWMARGRRWDDSAPRPDRVVETVGEAVECIREKDGPAR